MTTRVPVNPDLLNWAMERAGVSADSLVGKFPKLHEWLAGELAPTLKQLEAFATVTHTAIGLLFLPQPPEEPLPIPDFRTLPEARLSRPSADLFDTIYLCQQRQAWYRDHQRLYGAEPLAFVGSASVTDEVSGIAARIAQTIGFDLAERGELPNWSEALRRLITQFEEAGVLVMVSGVVGSNTRRPLRVEEFRGFALADALAPLIFINGKDSKAAQMFTLAHELAHLWLGESGVSDSQAATLPNEETERWCNAVAAELLVPLEQLRQIHQPVNALQEELQRLARWFKVSTLVIVRRLYDLGALDEEMLWRTYREELERVKALVTRESGGGDFYNSLGARVSKRFASAVVGSTLEGQTPFTDAFRMLGIRKSATFYEEARRLGNARMSYLLDANVFMAANNLHYGLDFCPAFWNWLIQENARQRVFSIEKVGDEIEAGGDELADWAKDVAGPLFLKPDAEVLSGMGRVSQWVTENGYTPAAVNTFLQVADYWLVSHALAHGQVVVTHEKPANTPHKVKIPNVCVGLGIKVMTPFEMLRHERARFVLGGWHMKIQLPGQCHQYCVSDALEQRMDSQLTAVHL